jgi:hypothetical protein
MERILIIRKSMIAFGCGLVGVLPVIGLLPAIVTLIYWRRVLKMSRGQWNPAAGYLRAGAFLALCGLAGTTLALLLFIAQIYD